MVITLWIVWIVFCCGFYFVRMLQPHRSAATLLAPIVLLGPLTFFVWRTDGRFAAFAVLGFLIVYAALLALVRVRARDTNRAGFKTAAIGLVSPATFFGTIIGAGVEIGGRWSGPDFVVWRAALAGSVLFAAGMALFIRATGTSSDSDAET